MLFQKHPFGILALNFLLQARQTFAEEDHTLFETEFRLMIIVGFPDRDMATVEGEDGVFWPGKHEDKENKDWALGTKTPEGQGNYRVNYMAWSRPSDKERTLWLHDKENDKDSGRKCTVRLDHDPKVPRLDWYTWADWGLDADSTINEFQQLEGLYIICTSAP